MIKRSTGWIAAACVLCVTSQIHGQTVHKQEKISSTRSAPQPNIIVMISVDMLSGEIMDRYTKGLSGGLGKILREGVVFSNGYQEHAFTETCPGHSTLLSGRHPSSTGIASNSWLDVKTGKMVYCVEDDTVKTIGDSSGQTGASDRWFKGTTFGTWLKDEMPGSRVYAMGGKARASIMMAGPKADGVYWFEENFGFTTSTAYAQALPKWLEAYNKVFLEKIHNESTVWAATGPADGLTSPGEWKADLTGYPIVSRLPRLLQTQGFPYTANQGFLLGETQNGGFWNRFRASPFWDEAIFGAAETLIVKEHLGEGTTPDLLCLALSSTNAAEHAFGNQGPEMQDMMRQLDHNLGVFLDSLQKQGKTAVVVLSADHGGLDFAERLRDQGVPAKRVDIAAWLKELQLRVQRDFHTDKTIVRGGDQEIYIDQENVKSLGDKKEVTTRIEAIIRSMPDVAVVASVEELHALPERRFEDPRLSSLEYRLKFSAYPGRTADILFAFQPLVERNGPPLHDPAQHGTPHDYDRRVPIIFWGPWQAQYVEKPASTVDIAPTLAREFGLKPEEAVDGVPLLLLRKQPTRSH